MMAKREKVTCPYCGQAHNIMYDPVYAKCRGIFVRCKGRQCRKEFEVRINQDR